MEQHKVLIISEHKTDHLILSACLERAAPSRFKLASQNLVGRPLEALLDPSIDAVIMAYGPETEYLLRLAQKNEVTVPLILLLDDCFGAPFGWRNVTDTLSAEHDGRALNTWSSSKFKVFKGDVDILEMFE